MCVSLRKRAPPDISAAPLSAPGVSPSLIDETALMVDRCLLTENTHAQKYFPSLPLSWPQPPPCLLLHAHKHTPDVRVFTFYVITYGIGFTKII